MKAERKADKPRAGVRLASGPAALGSDYPHLSAADLRLLLGLPEQELNDVMGCLVPSGGKYRWRDVEPLIGRQVIARARSRARQRLTAIRTSKHWISGYPKLVARWHPTRNGDLYPFHVRYGSHMAIWWKCPQGPDHEWRAMACEEVRRRGQCPFCSNRRVSVTNSLAAVRPDLARQWHPRKNGHLRPTAIVATSSKRAVWWKCPRGADHQWRIAPSWRIRGYGCPFCAGKRISRATSLGALEPELAAAWHPTRNGTLTPWSVGRWSRRPFWWRCRRGHAWLARPRAARGPCSRCTGTTSRPQARRGSRPLLAEASPKIAAQWHPTKNGRLTPRGVTAGSSRSVWWLCSAGGDHVWQASVSDRTRGVGCPFCAGVRVSATNSVAGVAPHVVAEWHATRNGSLVPSMVGAGSNKKYWWRCTKGHVWQTAARNRALYRTGCPRCVRRGGRVARKPPRAPVHAPSHAARAAKSAAASKKPATSEGYRRRCCLR